MVKSNTARVLFGIVLSAAASFALAELFAGSAIRNILPLAFIAVLYLLAWRYGIAVGVVGSLLCAMIFAHFLFDPLGSLHVGDAEARRNILWMIVGATVLSSLLGPSNTTHPKN